MEVRYANIPLRTPYVLSFATLSSIDVFYLIIGSDGRVGIGEVTPLPGYGGETADAIKQRSADLALSLEKGSGISDLVDSIYGKTPMLASALACAAETWREGEHIAYGAAVEGDIPMLAPCSGHTPEAAARSTEELVKDGYRTIKAKIGWSTVDEDVNRIAAVASRLPPGGRIRIDANQGLLPEQALALCRRLEGLPVEHLEQPFPPEQWRAFQNLAGATSLPLMLDESIWRADDLHRAVEFGAKSVKLKLCKHRGMAGVRKLVRLAEQLGLAVTFGNGVQTALGNHLEARLYRELGMKGASEGNGFLKIDDPMTGGGLQVRDGHLKDRGLDDISTKTTWGEQVTRAEYDEI